MGLQAAGGLAWQGVLVRAHVRYLENRKSSSTGGTPGPGRGVTGDDAAEGTDWVLEVGKQGNVSIWTAKRTSLSAVNKTHSALPLMAQQGKQGVWQLGTWMLT